MEQVAEYAGRLKDSIVWWLGRRKPFIINDEYRVELLYIDREHYSAKLKITNIKTGEEIDGSV